MTSSALVSKPLRSLNSMANRDLVFLPALEMWLPRNVKGAHYLGGGTFGHVAYGANAILGLV